MYLLRANAQSHRKDRLFYYKQNYIGLMDNDKGLIGFLEKKSLFNADAQKNARKKRSNTINSNDKDSIIKKITEKDVRNSISKEKYESTAYNLKSSVSSNDQIYIQSDSPHNIKNFTQHTKSRFVEQSNPLSKQLNQSIESLYKTKEESLKNNSRRGFETPQNLKNSQKTQVVAKPPNSFLNTLTKSRQQKEMSISNSKEKPIKFWQGVITRTVGFESARAQTAQCLERLSFNIKIQLSNLNSKIESFRKDIFEFLKAQVQSLREKLITLVQETFQQSSKYISEYMLIEEQRVAGDLLKFKEQLENYYIKIENMKEQINRPQWRKVAGEILSTELETNIQNLLKQSNEKIVYSWQKRSLGREKIKNITNELKQLIKLKE